VRFGNFAAANAISLLLSDVVSGGDDGAADALLAQSAATISIDTKADAMPPLRPSTGFSLVPMNPPLSAIDMFGSL
jgi:hypothetical protein